MLRCPRCGFRLLERPIGSKLLPVCRHCGSIGHDEIEQARRRARYATLTAAQLAATFVERRDVTLAALDRLADALAGCEADRWPAAEARWLNEALGALTDVRAAWVSQAYVERRASAC